MVWDVLLGEISVGLLEHTSLSSVGVHSPIRSLHRQMKCGGGENLLPLPDCLQLDATLVLPLSLGSDWNSRHQLQAGARPHRPLSGVSSPLTADLRTS